MATHGTMKAFNAQVDEWPIYVERLQVILLLYSCLYMYNFLFPFYLCTGVVKLSSCKSVSITIL